MLMKRTRLLNLKKDIDQATTRTQLKMKEALHIHWEKPSLNQQLFHANLNLSL